MRNHSITVLELVQFYCFWQLCVTISQNSGLHGLHCFHLHIEMQVIFLTTKSAVFYHCGGGYKSVNWCLCACLSMVVQMGIKVGTQLTREILCRCWSTG